MIPVDASVRGGVAPALFACDASLGAELIRDFLRQPRRLLCGRLQVLLAAASANFEIGFLTGDGDTELTFAEIRAGQWLRVLRCLLYLAAAIGLLTRWFAGHPALGLIDMMIGAAIVEIMFLDNGNPVAPLVIMTLLSVVVRFRRDTIAALPDRLAPIAQTNRTRVRS